MEIYNMLGQKVITQPITYGENRINTEKLNSGTYLYKILNTSGNIVKTDKLIINR
jgi:hypothetical protein